MMMKLSEVEREKFQLLLMAAVDGELSSEDRTVFDQYLHQYSECQEEWQRYVRLKEVVREIQFAEPPQEIWNGYSVRVYGRIERGIAWIAFSIGCIILLAYGGFKTVEALIADPQLQLVVKIAFIADISVVVMLVLSQLLMLLLSIPQHIILWQKPVRLQSSEPQ